MRRLRDRGGPGGTRYTMREKMFSIGDDFWIETDGGDRLQGEREGTTHPRNTGPGEPLRRGAVHNPGKEAQRARPDADRARREDGGHREEGPRRHSRPLLD